MNHSHTSWYRYTFCLGFFLGEMKVVKVPTIISWISWISWLLSLSGGCMPWNWPCREVMIRWRVVSARVGKRNCCSKLISFKMLISVCSSYWLRIDLFLLSPSGQLMSLNFKLSNTWTEESLLPRICNCIHSSWRRKSWKVSHEPLDSLYYGVRSFVCRLLP